MLPSFCRVTGKSRNLPKPNYFPLLPPISPAEARNIFRSRGKSFDDYYYVPIIEFGRPPRIYQCRITEKSAGNENHHFDPLIGFKREDNAQGCRITTKHQINGDYRYVYPILDIKHVDKDVEHLAKILIKLTNCKSLDNDEKFVYPLDEERLNLVVSAAMEEAVRCGEIESLLLSKDGSKTLLRLKHGRSVSLSMRTINDVDESDLYHGSGQDEHVLEKQIKIQQYKKRKTSDSFLGCRLKYFQDKENVEKEHRPPSKKQKEVAQEEEIIYHADWNERTSNIEANYRSATNLLSIGTDWRDLLYPKVETWDWDTFPKYEDCEELPTHQVDPVQVAVDSLSPGFSQPKVPMNNETLGFETVPVFEQIKPLDVDLDTEIVQAVDQITTHESIQNVFNNLESLMFLPFIGEVSQISDCLDSGTKGFLHKTNKGIEFVHKDNVPTKSIGGLMIKIHGEDRFIVGQNIQVNQRQVFIPGQSITTDDCDSRFVPGITVQSPEGPGFIPGYSFQLSSKGKRFIAGQIVETEQGKKFIHGQALQTLFGPKFVPGQTIQTSEGLKFVAGHNLKGDFIAGQIFQTAQGATFIPGQTFDTPQGARFVAGQVTQVKGSHLDFIPGQSIVDQNGCAEFVPGQTIETPDGPVFVPGQTIRIKNQVKYIPGRQMTMDGGQLAFVPGETLVTKEGSQFVAGRLIDTDNGPQFVPGQLKTSEHGYSLITCSCEQEVFTKTGLKDGLAIDNSTLSGVPWKTPDMGYMVQDEQQIKFLPTEKKQEEFGEVKIVPGQLLEIEESPKFVPGKMIETAFGSRFIPGQIVKTNKGEQFVPGQVVETKNGPKFVPGQVVETKEGKKFVPGQVFETKNGPRFVPGQILITKYGSTFIPGQVVYTDEGSRFVPGNIVETSIGPQFVPGQVADLGNSVKFFPGQIIETETGPRYVAQEIDHNIENDEFLVQSFQVSPEELRLITAYPYAALHYPILDEPMIDTRMLHQMAAAGVAVNRHTINNLYDVKICAPNDTDESILGANVFRMTDPILEPVKAKKVKKDSDAAPQVAPPESNDNSVGKFDTAEKIIDEPTVASVLDTSTSAAESERTPEQVEPKSTPSPIVESSQVQEIPVEIPSFESLLPTETNTTIGECLKLSAQVRGHPEPKTRWMKDNQTIQSGDKVKISSENGLVSLEIESMRPEDAGKYSLVACNDHGEIGCQVVVKCKPKSLPNVPEKPSFNTTLPSEAKITIGEPLKLSAKISGHPKPNTTWLKDGVPITHEGRINESYSSDGSVSLEIKSTETADAGTYTLLAANDLGKISCDVSVKLTPPANVPQKPSFESVLPGEATIVLGESLKLAAQIGGQPKPETKWFKDDHPIQEGDRVNISSSTSQKVALEIESVRSEDAGRYTLIASNDQGEVISHVIVKVKPNHVPSPPEKPTFNTSLPSETNVVLGEPIKLCALIDGNPKPDAKWIKDDVPIEDTNHVHLSSSVDGKTCLEIDSSRVEDAGKYTLVATNDLGRVESDTLVKIKPARLENTLEKPTFDTVLPSEANVVEGKSLKLTAKISGYPKPQSKWLKDGEPITNDDHFVTHCFGDGTISLDIESVRAQDSGKYDIVVGNDLGEISSRVAVNIKPRPEANAPMQPIFNTTLPSETKAVLGEPLKLSAELSGNPIPDTKWLKDDLPIEESTRVHLSSSDDGKVSLEIKSSQEEDSGKYSLVASNELGKIASDTVVQIKRPSLPNNPEKPSFDIVLPTETNLVEGKPLKLSAKISGNPKPETKWLKDGKAILNDNRVIISSFSDGTLSLEIEAVRVEDSGNYTLVTSNHLGEVSSAVAVNVKPVLVPNPPEKPSFNIGLPSETNVVLGEPLKLCVAISGNPKPDIKWMKDNIPVQETSRVHLACEDGNVSLEIKSTQKGDSGKYSIIVGNNLGSISSDAMVKIKLAPIPNKPTKPSFDTVLPSEANVTEGQPLKLSAKISGHPKPETKWLKNGNVILNNSHINMSASADGSVFLEIGSVSVEDSGSYTLVTSNNLGEVSSVVAVNIKPNIAANLPQKPSFNTSLPSEANVVLGEPLKLSAELSGNPIPDTKWLKDDLPIEESTRVHLSSSDDGKVSLEIKSTQIEDAGKYSLVATNNLGESVSDATVKFKRNSIPNEPEKPSFDTSLPTEVNVTLGEPLKLSAEVSGHPPPDTKWFKDDNPIGPNHANQTSVTIKEVSLEIKPTETSDAGLMKPIARQASPEKPIFNMALPTETKITLGKPLKLIAQVSGNPQPDVQWMKDNIPIRTTTGRIRFSSTEDGKVSLEIDATKVDDTGKYSLVITNNLGQLTSDALVKIKPKTLPNKPEKPSFDTVLPAEANVVEGKPLTLTAKMSGNPKPETKWLKDGLVIHDNRVNTSVSKDGVVSLEIDSMTLEDGGTYSLVVSNNLGQVMASTFVKMTPSVGKPSFITTLPAETKADLGEHVKLSAQIKGNVKTDLLKDGMPLGSGSDATLIRLSDEMIGFEIKSLQEKDAGKYSLLVSNDFGQSQCNFKIAIRGEVPSFDSELPTQAKVILGQPLKLSAKVNVHEQKWSVHWYKDGVQLHGDNRVLLSSLPDGTLSLDIKSFQSKDAGKYSLTISNEHGDKTTEATVTMKPKPKVGVPEKPSFDTPLPVETKVVLDQPLTLSARIGGHPRPDVKWLKDGKSIANENRAIFATLPDGTTTFTFESVRLEDVGTYSLVVGNEFGQAICDTKVVLKASQVSKKMKEDNDILQSETLLAPPASTPVSRRGSLLCEFFSKIKSDLESVENDTRIRTTLEAAIDLAKTSDRNDLVDKVCQLKDVLKNTERDPNIVELISEVLENTSADYNDDTANELAKGDKEVIVEERQGIASRKDSEQKVDSFGENSSDIQLAVTSGQPKKEAQIRQDNHTVSLNNNNQCEVSKLPTANNSSDNKQSTNLSGLDSHLPIGYQRELIEEKPRANKQFKSNKQKSTLPLEAEKIPSTNGLAHEHVIQDNQLNENKSTPTNGQSGDESEDVVQKPLKSNWSYWGNKQDPSNGAAQNSDQPADDTQQQKSLANADTTIDADLKELSNTLTKHQNRRQMRKVTSRTSSRLQLSPMEVSEEFDESPTESLTNPTEIPFVITSSKDIPKEVIDVLRYGSDEAQKEMYTHKILKAIGCNRVSPDPTESGETSPRKQSRGSRKSSGACIILKDFLQTIVPRDAAHDVLIGEIDYMVIDDEGVRYFESASRFASRRNSRFEIRQMAISRRNSTVCPEADVGPWPWADVGPPQTTSNKRGRFSIEEFRNRMQVSDNMTVSEERRPRHFVNSSAPLSRSSSGLLLPISDDRYRSLTVNEERRSRHSVAVPMSVPLSRSNSGFLTPMSENRLRNRRLSLSVESQSGHITKERHRKIGVAESSLNSSRFHTSESRLHQLE